MHQTVFFRIKTSFSYLLLYLTASISLSTASDSGVFFLGNHDIPLIKGMILDEEQSVELDKPEGQISEYRANGPVMTQKIITYYTKSMPQLGWKLMNKAKNTLSEKALEFHRDQDHVTIFITNQESGTTTVTFRIMSTNT